MASSSTSTGTRVAMLFPVIILSVMALNQARLHATDQLSSWRGGGFGMFATVDRDYVRSVHVAVTGGAGEIFTVRWSSVASFFSADASRSEALTDAKALPSQHNLREIALLLAGLTWEVNGTELIAVKDRSGKTIPSSSFAVKIYGVTYDKTTDQVTPSLLSEWRGSRS